MAVKRNPHILIIEDEPKVASAIKREIVIGVGNMQDLKIGVPIITIAENALEAIVAYNRSDLITLDIMGVGVPKDKKYQWATAIADYAQTQDYYKQKDFELPAKAPEDGYDLLNIFNLLRVAEAKQKSIDATKFSGKPIIIYAAQNITRTDPFDTKGKDITDLLAFYINEMGNEIKIGNPAGYHPAIVLEKKGFAGQSRLPILRQWITYYLQQAE